MQYAQTLQTILQYIDDHLQDKLDTQSLAAVAGFSTHHFCRVFRFGIGYSVMSYVRLRRLLFAAAMLSSGEKIIDIALDYGFETHAGFSKAFRRHFGCAPEIYAKHAIARKPPLPSLAHLGKYFLGGIIMEPKFVTKSAIKLAGYALTTTAKGNEKNKAIPAFWCAYLQDGRVKTLHSAPFVKDHAEYGACFPENPETGEFVYAIAVEPKENTVIPPEFFQAEIPAATYAVFTTPPASEADFVANIQGTWQYIFAEWFPDAGYEFAEGGVDFELYDDRCMADTGKVIDIYIPVSPKK